MKESTPKVNFTREESRSCEVSHGLALDVTQFHFYMNHKSSSDLKAGNHVRKM